MQPGADRPRDLAMTMRNLFAGVNAPDDPGNLSDLEKQHVPHVEAPRTIKLGECFPVAVEVGKLRPHPNERDHFIEFIDLYADEAFLVRLDLTAVNAAPRATLWICLSRPAGILRCHARCNIHGVWAGTTPITVRD
jgi:superoxide reductase